MSPLSRFVRLRPEVAALDWERIRGHILFKDLISPLDSLEKDAEWLFSHTFPTTVLQAILQEIQTNLLPEAGTTCPNRSEPGLSPLHAHWRQNLQEGAADVGAANGDISEERTMQQRLL